MGKRVYGLNKIKLNKKIFLFAFAALSVFVLTLVVLTQDGNVLENQDDLIDGDLINVLVMGTDRQAGLCDVMMLVSIDEGDNTVTAVQIPRDTYAQYTSASYKKLNGASNSLGGAEQTAEWLADAFGIRIDHYVCVGLDTVRRVVDAIGGVDVDIPCNIYFLPFA